MEQSSNVNVSRTYEDNRKKLTLVDKIGFGCAGLGDNYLSIMVAAFLMYFLIDTVGMNPAVAGMVSMISILWDAFTDPIVGTLSDRSRIKAGRRRPFMLAGGLLVAIAAVLTFTKVEGSQTFQILYYTFMACFFWTSFTIFSVPYMALGVEITEDFNERNSIRGFVGAFGIGGVFFATSVSMMIVGHLSETMGPKIAWQVAGASCGIVSALTIIITYLSTRGKESAFNPLKVNKKRENVFVTLKKMLGIKTYLKLLVLQVIYAVGNGVISGTTIFILTAKMGMLETETSGYYAFTLVAGLLLVPVTVKSANKLGKKKAYNTLMLLSAVIYAILFLTDITTLVTLGLFGLATVLQQSAYQTLIISMTLDACDLIDYKTGTRNEALGTSLISLSMKAGFGVSNFVVGSLLAFVGYNKNLVEQTPETMKGILSMATLIAPVVFIITVVIIGTYKLTGERFKLLKDAIEKRNMGDEAYKLPELDEL